MKTLDFELPKEILNKKLEPSQIREVQSAYQAIGRGLVTKARNTDHAANLINPLKFAFGDLRKSIDMYGEKFYSSISFGSHNLREVQRRKKGLERIAKWVKEHPRALSSNVDVDNIANRIRGVINSLEPVNPDDFVSNLYHWWVIDLTDWLEGWTGGIWAKELVTIINGIAGRDFCSEQDLSNFRIRDRDPWRRYERRPLKQDPSPRKANRRGRQQVSKSKQRRTEHGE